MQLKTKWDQLTIVGMYAPQESNDKRKREETKIFYEKLQQVYTKINENHCTVIASHA